MSKVQKIKSSHSFSFSLWKKSVNKRARKRVRMIWTRKPDLENYFLINIGLIVFQTTMGKKCIGMAKP